MVVGGGGREHALAWKAAQSPTTDKVWVAPGNAGTAAEPGIENVAIDAEAIDALLAVAREGAVDMTIVGPEAPLVAGIVDRFRAEGRAIVGPTQAAAALEGSKAFAKDFLARHGIPTASYATFTQIEAAQRYIADRGAPIVIKADGLAAGKGVVVADTVAEAQSAVDDMLGGAFGGAGARVVVEDYLAGEEASFICLVDGRNVLPLASSQDHKARDTGDSGPNTGGMGAYSPAPLITDAVHERIMGEIIEPTVAGMAADGRAFTGFLYAGLMIDTDGSPRVLEFNVRGGDPEMQPIVMRLESDLVELCQAVARGTLAALEPRWSSDAALGVVMAAGGYPGKYRKGDPIAGLDAITDPQVKVFHAGTQCLGNRIVTTGGRVLCVTARGPALADAQERAYAGVEHISWADAHWRSDIGKGALSP
jgi:phosphoribosylamine--glycine ligase